MSKKKKNTEPPVQSYKGYFICRAGDRYRVKDDPNNHYAVHHGGFDSAQEAKEYLDEQRKLGYVK